MFFHTQLGNNGRLGNQLFQIASTLGIAKTNRSTALFPYWKYDKYFEKPIPHGVQKGIPLKEAAFNYQRVKVDGSIDYDLCGYFQSEKYFEHIVQEVKEQFTFKKQFAESVYNKISPSLLPNKKTLVAISVRRGDYLNNPNYVCLGDEYYKNAISIINEKVTEQKQFIVFSDDIPWCKRYFGEGFVYTDRLDAVEQLCLLTQCRHFITANSTYSWWGAWLGEKENSIVIAPDKWFGTGLAHLNDSDIIPHRWLKIPFAKDDNGTFKRADLRDVTFTIPVKYDHPDREENLSIVIDYLTRNFDTNIIVMEAGDVPLLSHTGEYAQYFFTRKQSYMHRTAMLNYMAKICNTAIIFNWDTDVLIDAAQILECVNKLRANTDMCYPYDGRFYRVNREVLKQYIPDEGLKVFKQHQPTPYEEKTTSYGGAVGFRKKAFIAGGMENEKFISYGPEDYERYHRFNKLGFVVARIKGPLYHIDHYTGPDSGTTHPLFAANHAVYEQQKKMSKQQLQQEIATWPWV